MTTDAQLAANRANAEHSTGPLTDSGKAASARNALTFGLFTMRDFVRPEEHAEYAQLCRGLWADLNPQSALEQTYATAIVSAAWRLRRCSLVESEMAEVFSLDPMEDAAGQRVQTSVDRARSMAFNILRRSTMELRRLQADRTPAKVISIQSDTAPLASNCNPSESTPRNASCPCGSGEKYKRCCGLDAPPVLGRAA